MTEAGNNIGVRTNNKALTFTTKVSEIGVSDLLVVFGRPCRVRRKTLDPSSGRIRFTSLDFFSGREKVCSFRPDADCEVPIVTYVDYWCIRVSEESQIVTLVSDDGTTREDVMFPTDRFQRKMIRTGLELGRKVIVTVAFAMGRNDIHIVSFAPL